MQHFKRAKVYGVDISRMFQEEAKQLLKKREPHKRQLAVGQAGDLYKTHDSIWVAEDGTTYPNGEPARRWTIQSGLPFDIEPFQVHCSASEAMLNHQSLDELMRRRFRRGFRERLLEAGVLPEKEALARVMRVEIHVTPRIYLSST